jgi:hypothetical protein
MSTVAEVLESALALSPHERAGIAHVLLQSLPGGPTVYRTEEELSIELNHRMQRLDSGLEPMYDAEETLTRARESLARSRAT